jgi:hypothetical protein
MAKKFVRWECETCKELHDRQSEAETCCFDGFVVEHIKDMSVHVGFEKGYCQVVELIYTLFLKFKKDSIVVKVVHNDGGFDIQELINTPSWWDEQCSHRLEDVLSDRDTKLLYTHPDWKNFDKVFSIK